MVSKAAKRFHGRFLFPLLILILTASVATADSYGAVVRRILDGDTLVLSDGERVRLLGLDAPERGEMFSYDAMERLKELTLKKEVELETCPSKDQYGRTLSMVWSEGLNVNRLLLEEGLAVPMLIPPCGKMVATQVLKAAMAAFKGGKGIYSLPEYRIINHKEAWRFIGKKVVVSGKVIALHKGQRAWHLNFGDDWKTDFTAVLFKQGRLRFEALGLEPERLVDSEVLVIGRLKSYNGPEIIIHGPDQIIPVN